MSRSRNRAKDVEEVVVEPVAVVEDTINTLEAKEEDKVSSVAEVMQRAEEDSRVDTTVVDELEDTRDPEVVDELEDTREPEVVETVNVLAEVKKDYSIAVTEIVKNKTMPLLDKIEAISKIMPDASGKVVRALLAIYNICSKVKTRVPTLLNPEQKAFVRSFVKLCNEPTEEFNKAMKYINWIYKQLSDTTVLDKEGLVIIRGVSPIDPTISTLFIAGKDDKELVTYVYLSTIIDFRANAKTAAEKSKKADILKITSDTILTDDIVNKINSFYDN